MSAITYQNPTVINPPQFDNPGGAHMAVLHFGRMLELLVFTAANHKWRSTDADPIDDGRHERGAPVVFNIRGVFQPNTQKRGRGVMEDVTGGLSETNYIVHVYSHDPINLTAVQARPDVFPTGLRLFDFDDYGLEAGVNFPMAIRFRGNTYKITQPIALFAGGETQDNDSAIYRAECKIWRDANQERDARGGTPVWGPSS